MDRLRGVVSLTVVLVVSFLSIGAAVAPNIDLYMGSYAPGDEIVEERSKNSKTYYEGEGAFRLEAFSGPIHYRDDIDDLEELYKDIDETVQISNTLNCKPYPIPMSTKSNCSVISNK